MASIPLVPSLVLGLFSFLSSALILCRLLLPILPPTPCSRRPPAKRVGAHIKELCSADISHVWLSIFDSLSLIVFLVQVFYQYVDDSPSFDAATHGGSAACLWLALTARQTCLLIVLAITLLNVRLGRSTYFGAKHLYLWLSTIGLVATGGVAAALLSILGFNSLFGGIAVYLSVVTVLTTGLLGFLVLTLSRVKRNLERDSDAQEIDPWPAPRKRRASFATDEVQAIKDGASWITSIEGSARRSLSPWSFSTGRGSHPKSKHASRHSMPASFYSLTSGSVLSEINAMQPEDIPPVPPLPSPYKKSLSVHIVTETPADGTPTSWLTSLSGTVKTMSPFSFPTTRPPSIKSIASRFTGRQRKDALQPSSGTTAVFPVTFSIPPKELPTANPFPLRSLALTTPPQNYIVTKSRVIIWLAIICLPFMLTMPYLILARYNYDYPSRIPGILLAIAQAIPSLLLALSMLFNIRLPIPSNLFDHKPRPVKRKSTATTTALPIHRCSTELRVRGKSGSYTAIEGRRSGDIWIQQGQAVDGLSKAGRVVSLLVPNPRLSVLPLHKTEGLSKDAEYTKPRKSRSSQFHVSQDEDVDEIALVPQRTRPSYATDSPPSVATQDGSPVSQFQVMTAQRYQPFPARILRFSGAQRTSRGPPMGPPPTMPLPPTLDESLEEASPKQIDSLSAGMLPLLIPGLTVSDIQPVTPYSDDRRITLPSSDESKRSRERHQIEAVGMPIETPKVPRCVRRSYSIVTSPDDQSTPRFQFPKHTSGDQSLPPLPSKLASHSRKPNHSTPAQVVAKAVDDKGENHEISLVPEEDTLSRKLNSLIRSLGSPGTPSSASNGILGSPVKPLIPRRAEGVMRHKPISQRYSPLKISRRETTSKIPLPRQQSRDGKSLYNHLTSRAMRAPVHKDASPEKRAPPMEYLPAINRLSAIITDYESKQKQTAANDLNASKASYSIAQRQPFRAKSDATNASHIGEFAQLQPRGSLVDGKENASVRSSSGTATLNRTDTAKHRTHLMQNQQLPTVVIRPPSGGSFQALGPAPVISAWNTDMI